MSEDVLVVVGTAVGANELDNGGNKDVVVAATGYDWAALHWNLIIVIARVGDMVVVAVGTLVIMFSGGREDTEEGADELSVLAIGGK